MRVEVNALVEDPNKPKAAKIKALRLIARRVAKEAMDGNMAAVHVIGDRLEGKPTQAVEVATVQKQGNPEVMTWLEQAVSTLQEGRVDPPRIPPKDKDKLH